MIQPRGWNTVRNAATVGHAQGSVYPAHLSRQLQPDLDALRAMKHMGGGEPTLKPLLGPPGPPKGHQQEWKSVPTRQNYEDPQESAKQGRYMRKYGTLYPE